MTPAARIADATAGQVDAVVALLESVWSREPGAGPITAPVLHTLLQTGACVRVANAHDGCLVGAAVAFARTDRPSALHLHVVGVASGHHDGGLGRALLDDVGRWAVAHGLRAVEWTFDPLVRRNAHVYLRTPGARVVAYLRDPYGDGHDRLLLEWEPRHGAAAPTVDPADPEIARFAVPADIVALRAADPGAAAVWAARVRDALGGDGVEVLGLDAEDRYVVRRRTADLIAATT